MKKYNVHFVALDTYRACHKILIIVLFLVISFSCVLDAALNGTFVHTTQADFLQGTLDKVLITSDGVLQPWSELVEVSGIKENYIWCLAKDSKGCIYAGTGDNGVIYKIENGSAKKFCKLEERGIYTIAIDKENNLYAATFPDPKIYKIDHKGKTSLFYKSDEQYIWCLTIDEKNNLYVGTGINGKIFKIGADGRAKEIYDSKETHILSFVMDKNQNIYAGTSDTGIIYKITREDKISILYQIGNREIHTLCLDDEGNIYAGSSRTGSAIQSVQQVQQQVPRGATYTPVQQQQTHVQQAISEGAIYKITMLSDGAYVGSLLHQSSDPVIFSLVFHENNLYAGTGDIRGNGMLYRTEEKRNVSVLFKNVESQIISVVAEKENIYIGTAGDGKVFKVGTSFSTGKLTSVILDASQIVQWSAISFNKKGSIEVETRTGNSREPDDTWSNWVKASFHSTKYTKGSFSIKSQGARFFQYRILFLSNESEVSFVEVHYAGKNQSPEIQTITVGADEPKPKSKTITISWAATDPDKDILIYELYYKYPEEKRWKKLKEEIKENTYNLDSETISDGAYFIKVVASDSPCNPKGTELKEEKVSKQFFIDNTPPVVSLNVKVGKDEVVISGSGIDNLSVISKLEYSFDSDKWLTLTTLDGIFDSSSEEFSFRLTKDDIEFSGEHTVAVKATDSAGNTSISSQIFNLK